MTKHFSQTDFDAIRRIVRAREASLQDPDRLLKDPRYSQATLLDKKGRVEFEEEKFTKPGVLSAFAGDDYRDADTTVPDHVKRNLDRAPEVTETRYAPLPDGEMVEYEVPRHIAANLDRAAEVAGPFEPRNSLQTWEECLTAPLADGATTTSAAEVLVTPLFTLPANYLYPGRILKWTWFGRQSTAITTPGTITLRTAYSATGLGAVVVAATGAFAPDPTAAATTLPYAAESTMICRSTGTSGTAFGWISTTMGDYDDASATSLKGNLDMQIGGSAGGAAPAAVTIDTTVARAWMPTHQESAATHSHTCHVAYLEAVT